MVSYTTVSPLLIFMSGLFSVALIPWIAPGGYYPPLCPMESGLSSVFSSPDFPRYFHNAVIRATLLALSVEEQQSANQLVFYRVTA